MGVLRSVYLANRVTEATLRSIVALEPMVVTGAGDSGGDVAPGLDGEHRAAAGLLRLLAEELRLIRVVGGSLQGQAQALAQGSAEDLAGKSAATERGTLTLREVLHSRLRLARLLAGDRSPPIPATRLRLAAGRLASAEGAVRAAAAVAIADLLLGQAALAAALERCEAATLATAREPAAGPGA